MRNLPMKLWQQLATYRERPALWSLDAAHKPIALSHHDWIRQLQRVAAGLMSRGLEPGVRVGLVAPNSAAWLTLAVSVWLAGGCVVPLMPGRERRPTLRALARSGCDWIVARDLHAIDALRGQAGDLPEQLRWVALEDGPLPPSEQLMTLKQLDELGRHRLLRGDDKLLNRRIFDTALTQPSLILFDPDEREDPHGAFYTGEALGRMLDHLAGDALWPDDARLASLVSYGDGRAFLMSIAALFSGHALAHGDTIAALRQQLQALSPTHLMVAPEFLCGRASAWQQRVEQAPELLRKLAEPEARSSLTRALANLGASAAKRAMYEPIRQELGDALRVIYALDGHAPSPAPELLDAMGVALLGVFGLPECGISHMARQGASRPGAVGRPVQGYACKIDAAKAQEPGEILIRSEELFSGYWDQRGPRTVEAGWLRTGVRGHMEEGFLWLEPAADDESNAP